MGLPPPADTSCALCLQDSQAARVMSKKRLSTFAEVSQSSSLHGDYLLTVAAATLAAATLAAASPRRQPCRRHRRRRPHRRHRCRRRRRRYPGRHRPRRRRRPRRRPRSLHPRRGTTLAAAPSSTVRRAAHAAHAQESQAARIKSKIRLATFAKVLEIALSAKAKACHLLLPAATTSHSRVGVWSVDAGGAEMQ